MMHQWGTDVEWALKGPGAHQVDHPQLLPISQRELLEEKHTNHLTVKQLSVTGTLSAIMTSVVEHGLWKKVQKSSSRIKIIWFVLSKGFPFQLHNTFSKISYGCEIPLAKINYTFTWQFFKVCLYFLNWTRTLLQHIDMSTDHRLHHAYQSTWSVQK